MKQRLSFLLSRHRWLILASLALLVLILAILVFGPHSSRLAGFLALYLEESGVPMPIPGDVMIAYVGSGLTGLFFSLVLAWIGLTACIFLGSTNLYLLSRRYAPHLLSGAFARFFHISPQALQSSHLWIARWGFWAVAIGRHIPGLRIPLTVVAGSLGMSYWKFALATTLSGGAWTLLYLYLGALYGSRVLGILYQHFWPTVIIVLLAIIFLMIGRLVWIYLRPRP